MTSLKKKSVSPARAGKPENHSRKRNKSRTNPISPDKREALNRTYDEDKDKEDFNLTN